MLSPKTRQFIERHIHGNPALLRLSAKPEEGLDIAFAVEQIAIRQQLHDKLPDWAANFDLVFPSRVSGEQSSSELTARYKQRFISGGSLMDLTGGLGVDFFYLSQAAETAIYIDKKEENCIVARHNLAALGRKNTEVRNGDSIVLLSAWSRPLDLIYVDPSRRDGNNRRTYGLSDCEPDVAAHKSLFFEKAKRVLIKASPMVDVKQLLVSYPEATEVHIVSVRNECKEVLLFVDTEQVVQEPTVFCVNLSPEKEEVFTFTFSEEESATVSYAAPQAYLYEPNASVLKAGAFKAIAQRYDLKKLGRHSHLYTSPELCEAFPGRIFEKEEVFPFNNRLKKELPATVPKANISVRNFPLSVAEIRQQTKIKEGGEVYLFATTLELGEKVVIKAKKANLSR